MTTTAGDVLTVVSQVLYDETNTRWPAAELLTHLNEAQRQVVSFYEVAGTQVVVAQLEANKALQSLPTGGRYIKDITRNHTPV